MNRPYEIVTAGDLNGLAMAINQLIEQGYEPCGGLIAAKVQAKLDPIQRTIFMQAVYLRVRITIPLEDATRVKANGD